MTESLDPKSIFGRAREIESADDRSRFLDAACSHDPSLRAEVDTLLRAVEATGDFLERPLIAARPPIEDAGTRGRIQYLGVEKFRDFRIREDGPEG